MHKSDNLSIEVKCFAHGGRPAKSRIWTFSARNLVRAKAWRRWKWLHYGYSGSLKVMEVFDPRDEARCKMNVRWAEEICDWLRERGYSAKVHPAYSGRGMYGHTRVGISTDASGVLLGLGTMMTWLEHLDGNRIETSLDMAVETAHRDIDWEQFFSSQDSLGRSTIYY